MTRDMLAELSHLFFLEATDWWEQGKSDADRARLMRISHELASVALAVSSGRPWVANDEVMKRK